MLATWRDVLNETFESAWDGMTTDRIIEANGFRLRVREQGSRRRRPVVLIHGFSQSLESWDAWADDLARDHRVIRFDLPGHGLSGPDPERRYSNDETVGALSGLIEAMGLRKPILMGNSLGGLVAWRYASQRPADVRSLVLLAPGGFPINGVAEEPAPVPPSVEAYLLLAPASAVRHATRSLYGDPSRLDQDRIALARAQLNQSGVGVALVQRLKAFTLPDPTADLSRIAAPALIIWGGKDAVIPVGHAARFADSLKRSEVALFNDLGHMPHEEAPARTLKRARAFIGRPAGANVRAAARVAAEREASAHSAGSRAR
ncbi:MAG: alpha/beta fold hydrolase [Maricaulaceae bacterium]|jgi:pimeloyl-ACP methyl ester carboxylesterase